MDDYDAVFGKRRIGPRPLAVLGSLLVLSASAGAQSGKDYVITSIK